jgi:hypothetical protein
MEMPKRFTNEQLRRLRNELSFGELFALLRWPHRRSRGQLIFVCPCCGESRSDKNPRENLVRCFHCERNFNPIDFTLAARRCDFVEAIEYLLSVVAGQSSD